MSKWFCSTAESALMSLNIKKILFCTAVHDEFIVVPERFVGISCQLVLKPLLIVGLSYVMSVEEVSKPPVESIMLFDFDDSYVLPV